MEMSELNRAHYQHSVRARRDSGTDKLKIKPAACYTKGQEAGLPIPSTDYMEILMTSLHNQLRRQICSSALVNTSIQPYRPP